MVFGVLLKAAISKILHVIFFVVEVLACYVEEIRQSLQHVVFGLSAGHVIIEMVKLIEHGAVLDVEDENADLHIRVGNLQTLGHRVELVANAHWLIVWQSKSHRLFFLSPASVAPLPVAFFNHWLFSRGSGPGIARDFSAKARKTCRFFVCKTVDWRPLVSSRMQPQAAYVVICTTRV